MLLSQKRLKDKLKFSSLYTVKVFVPKNKYFIHYWTEGSHSEQVKYNEKLTTEISVEN